MDNLTNIIINKNAHYEVEEWIKQGEALKYSGGTEQRVVRGSIPSITIQINYNNLSQNDYVNLQNAYETHSATTFICKLIDDPEIDQRFTNLGLNGSVWVFKKFEFEALARSRLFTGFVELTTSLFFNFPQYQLLMNEMPKYAPITTTNTSFIDLEVEPKSIKYAYDTSNLLSSMGQSARYMKDKGNLFRIWTLSYLLEEENFFKLLKFYRQKGGLMGTFGIPLLGTQFLSKVDYYPHNNVDDNYVDDGYVDDDYVDDGHVEGSPLFLARFQNESIQYNKSVNNVYMIDLKIVESRTI